MADALSYYITSTDTGWQLKKEGGVKVIKIFTSKEEAVAYAQVMISKQNAHFRIQDRFGIWQTI